VIEVVVEAPDTVTLRLRLFETDGFLPGQYYNVRLGVPGQSRPVQRTYSVGSSPLPDASVIDLGVREVPGGMVSPLLVRDIDVGQRLEVRGPSGRFIWKGDDSDPLLLVGAGSGLVPLMAMIRYAVETDRHIPVCLVCSAVTYDHALYREELARLSRERDWLRVVHSVTRDPEEPRATYHRRIDRDLLADVLDGDLPMRAYVCGPPMMVEAAASALTDLGVDPKRVCTEKYD
jgi:ferredoxin-NADP reductase